MVGNNFIYEAVKPLYKPRGPSDLTILLIQSNIPEYFGTLLSKFCNCNLRRIKSVGISYRYSGHASQTTPDYFNYITVPQSM